MGNPVKPVAAPEARPTIWRQALADLKPFTGRAALTWRVALLCALVTGVAMMYEIPEAAISCYLVIFLIKPDALANVATGLGFLVLLPGLIALLAWIINITSGSTAHIMLAIFISSALLLYIGAATQLGEKGGVAALIIAFVLTLIVQVPFGEAATFALREAWAMAALPMIMMVAFNLVLGFSPLKLLRAKLLSRLAASADALESSHQEFLLELLHEGNANLATQAMAVRVLHILPKGLARQVAADARASYALMLAVAALPDGLSSARRAQLTEHVRAVHRAIALGQMPPAVQAERGVHPAEQSAWAALGVFAGEPEPVIVPAPKAPFVFADALTNPAYPRFALKTTAAAIICFMIYTAIDWQGIHTAMVTCYVAALGTTGETVHKLVLRITGALVGAALGIAAIFLVIPHIDGIAALMVLVFFGVLVGAWVSTGPERISYAGVQIALAFLLTILQGFEPSVSLSTAWDRIAGILLGNFVVYLIFTNVWPDPLEGQIRSRIAQALTILASMARLPSIERHHAIGSAAAVEALVGKNQESLSFLPFETRALRPGVERESALEHALAQIEALNREIWLSKDSDLGPISTWLDALAHAFQKPLEQRSKKIDDILLAVPALPFSYQLHAIERAA
jgi:multidrug resistance protein MdtO